MTWRQTLTALSYRLADLYFTTTDARQVATKAAFDVGSIQFTGNSKSDWENILYYADTIDEGTYNHNMLIALLEIVTSPDERGKKEVFLKAVLQNLKTGGTLLNFNHSENP